MRLCEHPEFEQAILRAADHFRSRGLRPALIEKDYYVTETLRRIAGAVGGKVIFKGGTSLSKGWNLIQRFSEDVDIFLDPRAFAPELRGRAIDFARSYFAPPGMSFARSEALFPPLGLAETLAQEYEVQCRTLCLGPYPSWTEVLARFEQRRNRL